MKITVIMADECSATSVTGAVDVLYFADLLHRYRTGGKEQLFHIETASLDGSPITCFGGMSLTPQKGLADIASTDLVLVPGFLPNILTHSMGLGGCVPGSCITMNRGRGSVPSARGLLFWPRPGFLMERRQPPPGFMPTCSGPGTLR